MRQRFIAILARSCLLLAVCAPAARGANVDRILRSLDFEERRLGNDESLPMHWSKVEGEGLPHYVNGALVTDRHASGTHSFRFDLNGGSLIYQYDPKQIKVQPGAHYRVDVRVQTTALQFARACLTGYFIDIDGHRVSGSLKRSELFTSASNSQSQWKQLSIELSADTGSADARHHDPIGKPAYLVIELGLLQPMHYLSTLALGDRTLFNQDIRGSAWFDDVTVSQVPKVTLTTDRPGNIYRRGDSPIFSVLVNDRFTDDLAAQLVIRNPMRQVVFQRSGALDMRDAETIGPGAKRMSLALPDLPPGWYSAALVMTSMGQYVGEQSLDFVLLADSAPPVVPDQRFGVIATELPFDGWSELPDILPYLSAGRVKLAVWSAGGDIELRDADAFDHLLERLQERGITPTACLIDLPPSIAEQLKSTSWLKILSSPKEHWRPQLAQLIARHANHLQRWQLGADNTDAFVIQPAMREVYSKIYDEFAALVDRPDLAMPWPAWYELEGKLPATVALSVPPSVLPSQLPLYMQDLQQSRGGVTGASSAGPQLSLSLQLLDRDTYGRDKQIVDFAQRLTYALAAGADRIDLPLPFTVRREGDSVVKQPQEMLIIQRTLITALGGAEFKGKVPIADGVEAFLFSANGRGTLVLWNSDSAAGVKELPLNLADQSMHLDLWGNASPLLQAGGKDGNLVRVEIGEFPVLLTGVDASAARLRASVALDRPLLESSFQPHTRRLRFTNPYPQAIGGSFKLRGPAGWTITPPTYTFTLNPGETFDREVTLEFPYNSFAGTKSIIANFEVQADTNVRFSVPISLKLGLSDVGLQTMALRDGDSVIVQQMITNYGDKPIDYSAFAIVPGRARQERLVTGLGAGRTTIKRYRFPEVPADANELRVRSGVKELVGTRILNDEVLVQ